MRTHVLPTDTPASSTPLALALSRFPEGRAWKIQSGALGLYTGLSPPTSASALYSYTVVDGVREAQEKPPEAHLHLSIRSHDRIHIPLL